MKIMRQARPLVPRERMRGERAASLVEYALLVALIAIVCFAAIVFLGDSASTKISSTGNSVAGAGSN